MKRSFMVLKQKKKHKHTVKRMDGESSQDEEVHTEKIRILYKNI